VTVDTGIGFESGVPERRRDWLKRNSSMHALERFWCTWCGFESTDDKEFPPPEGASHADIHMPVLCAVCFTSKRTGELPTTRGPWQVGHGVCPKPTRAQLDEIARLWAKEHGVRGRPGFPVPGRENELPEGREVKRKPKTWISIELVQLLDQARFDVRERMKRGEKPEEPSRNRELELVISEGSTIPDRLTAGGRAHIDEIDPGNYKLLFTEIDAKRWGRGTTKLDSPAKSDGKTEALP
jgi:hypothetical protein